jgi:hypothetical protein
MVLIVRIQLHGTETLKLFWNVALRTQNFFKKKHNLGKFNHSILSSLKFAKNCFLNRQAAIFLDATIRERAKVSKNKSLLYRR